MVVSLLAVIAILAIGIVLAFRWLEGETIYSSGYSQEKWDKIENGMNKDRVLQILGPPLDYKIKWGFPESEERWDRSLWSRPQEGKGYFSCIWFDQDKVVRKQIWFND